MKTDFSRLFYKKYFNRSDRLIEVALNSKRKVTGEFVSFFLGDKYKDSTIIQWHMVTEKHKKTLGIDGFDIPTGEIINQNDIESITFLDDNSVMTFK